MKKVAECREKPLVYSTHIGYERLDWLPGTSNQCELLFSREKLTLGHLRQGLSPMHLEAQLFLFLNYWDAQLVSSVVYRKNNPE